MTNELGLAGVVEDLAKKTSALELRATILEQTLTSLLKASGAGDATRRVLTAQRDAQAKTPEQREAYRVILEMLSN
jgi:hypothetical protein